MKARVNQQVRTLVPVFAEFSSRTIPQGSTGTIVECFEQPEGYAVDLVIPAPELVGGVTYENVVLVPDQFEVVEDDA